jgi:hypothetical protein
MLQEKDKLFWKLNLAWWAIDMAVSTLPTYKLPEGSPLSIFFFYVLHYGAMVMLTYLYRVVYNKINPEETNDYLLVLSSVIGVIIIGGTFFLLNSHDFIYHYKFWEGTEYTFEMRIDYLTSSIWQSSPWFLGYHIIRYSRVSTEREVKLRMSLQDSELERLRKQLNPHFLSMVLGHWLFLNPKNLGMPSHNYLIY